MGVLVATLALWAAAAHLLLRLRRERPEALPAVLQRARSQALFVAPRLLVGMLGAGFYAALVPAETVGPMVGPDSGLVGALLAAAAGAATPGGPIVAFSIAAALIDHAGPAQLLIYVSSWCLASVNRTLAWEAPVMGGDWVRARLRASAPALACIAAVALALHAR